ncbi:MAG: hypothetical protein FJ265_07380 [Planctomycetes bacterium]|nr:hypothetical protein [Planctomycetota bacterium]
MNDAVYATTTWGPDGPGPAAALHVFAGDFTIAGDRFASRIATWNPATGAIATLGAGMNGSVLALAVMANGDLVAGGDFSQAGGQPANRIARWNGAAWSSFGAGADDSIRDLEVLPNGELCVAGRFITVDGRVSSRLALLTTTCPAGALHSGTGCASTVGPMVLEADALPWSGGTYRATASPIAPGALAIGLVGSGSPGTSLATIHPAGGIGCQLLASADAVVLLSPNGGRAETVFAIPANPAFAGTMLHNQILQIELGAAANILHVANSNGLRLVIGWLQGLPDPSPRSCRWRRSTPTASRNCPRSGDGALCSRGAQESATNPSATVRPGVMRSGQRSNRSCAPGTLCGDHSRKRARVTAPIRQRVPATGVSVHPPPEHRRPCRPATRTCSPAAPSLRPRPLPVLGTACCGPGPVGLAERPCRRTPTNSLRTSSS